MCPCEASSPDNLTAVFPLPNCVLLPGGLLPLHVFEPRYRTMMSDLMAKPPGKRFLAVALLRGDPERLYQTNQAPIQPVVGLGEIVQHMALPDGCCNILTVGRARARVAFDDASGIYRRARLDLMPTEPSNILATVHQAVDDVRTLLSDIAELGLCDGELVDQILKTAPTAAAMIDIGAYHLLGPQDTAIKQRILEEERLEVRAEILALQLRRMIDTWRAAQICRNGPTPWPPLTDLN